MIEQKQIHRVGDALVTRIPELLLRSFKTTDLIPDWDAEITDRYDGWMVPDCLDAAHAHVVISTYGWLVQTSWHTIIVDTAVGNGKSRAMAAFDHLQEPWLEQLAAAGVEPEAVDLVLLRHLHTDHVGWNTRLVDGRWVPTFPNARYVLPQGEQDRLVALGVDGAPHEPASTGAFAGLAALAGVLQPPTCLLNLQQLSPVFSTTSPTTLAIVCRSSGGSHDYASSRPTR